MDRTKSDQIGVMATVMNALYMAEILRTIGMKAVVQTPFKVGSMTEEFSKDKALEHLSNNTVVFFLLVVLDTLIFFRQTRRLL